MKSVAHSKTIGGNLAAIGIVHLLGAVGVEITADVAISLLGLANVFLRLITKDEISISFSKPLTILLIPALALSLTACAGRGWTPPVECTPESKSIILERIPNPKEASLVLQLANLQSLKRHVYGVNDAAKLIDLIEEKLDHGITYAELVGYVFREVAKLEKQYGAEIFLMSQYLEIINAPLPISPCDVALIRAHLDQQRKVLMLVGE
jgi:hypothetical protein